MTSARSTVRLLAFTGATEWGGAEIVLGHLVAALGQHIDVSLLGVDGDIVSRIAASRPGAPWSLVPQVRGKRDLGAIRAHRRAVAGARPDIVQVNLPVPFAEPYTVLAATTVPHTRVVVVEHLPMAIPSPAMRLLKRMTEPRLSAHIAVGCGAAHRLSGLAGVPLRSIRVVPNGVPLPRSASVRRAAGGPFVIGAVGRLHRQKAFDVLIRSLVELPDAHLVLVGDGPERTALESLVATLRLGDRVTITGWTDSAADHLASFDVLALPSRFEGLPLVLLEAMLTGLPVVATGVGSVLDAVRDGETGLVVPVDDVPALTRSLRRLQDDPELRIRLGGAARRLALDQYTASSMARAYERVYADILGRH